MPIAVLVASRHEHKLAGKIAKRRARQACDGALAFPANATFEAVQGIEVTPTIVKGTALSAIRPERLLAAVAGKKPDF